MTATHGVPTSYPSKDAEQVEAAIRYGALGALYTASGEPAEAVPYSLRSVVIFATLNSPDTRIGLHWLARQRRVLGDKAFCGLLADHLAPPSIHTLLELLDQLPA